MGLFENATQDLNYKATEIDTSNLTSTQYINSNSIALSSNEVEEMILDDNESFNTYIEEIDDFSGNQYGEHTINKYLDIYADLDGDGSFTIMDKTLLQKYLSDGTEIKNNNLLFKIGDVDGDGKVTIADLSYIEKYETSGEFPVNNITVANRLDNIKYSNIKTQTENDLSEKYKKLQLIENTIGYYNYSKELQDRQDNSRESRIVKNKEKGYHHYLNKEKNNQSNTNNSKPFGANEAAEKKNYFYNYYKNNKLSAEEEKAIIEEYGSLEAAREAYNQNIASLNYSKKQLDKQIKLIPYSNAMNTAEFKKWANTKTLDDFNPEKNNTLANNSKYMESYKYLDTSQISMYNYLLETQGEEAANKFLDIYEDDINQSKGLERATEFIDKLDKNFDKIIKEDGTLMNEEDIDKLQTLLNSNAYDKLYDMDENGKLDQTDLEKLKQYIEVGGEIETTFKNLGITFGGGFQDGWNKFFEGFKYIFDDSSVLSAEEYKMMFIAQKLEQNGTIKGSYEFGQTVGNMVPVIMASAIATAATAPFGGEGGAAVFGTSLSTQQIGQITAATLIFSSTFGNSKHQALCNGHSLESAIGYGFLSGVSEAGLETLLGTLPFVGQETKNVFVAMFKEGLSESAQELVGSMIGYYTLGEEIDVTELSAGMGKAFIFGALLSGAGNGLTSGMKIVINGVKYKLTSSQIMAYYEASIDPKTGESNGLTLQEFVQENVNAEEYNNNDVNQNYQSVLNTISEKNTTQIEKEILKKVTPDMSEIEIARLVYFELGKKVDYSEEFKYTKIHDDTTFQELYNRQMTMEDLVSDNSIICVNWAQLYSKILMDAGFRADQIVIQRVVDSNGNYLRGSHAGIYVTLDDGSIIMPDLTAPIGTYDDAYNVKMNNDTTGFIVFTREQISNIIAAHDSYVPGGETILAKNIIEGDYVSLIHAMLQYSGDISKIFTIQNENVNNQRHSGVLPDTEKFLQIVGQFTFAAEGKVGGKERINLEKKLFDWLRKDNNSILADADTRIEQYKRDTSSLISSTQLKFVQSDAQVDLYKKMIENNKIDSSFLGIDSLNNSNMITIREYILQQIQELGLDKNSSPGNYVDLSASGLRKIIFTSEGAIIPLTVYKDGNPIGEYHITKTNKGKIVVRKTNVMYKDVLVKLNGSEISLDERAVLEKITPDMNQADIQKICDTMFDSKVITTKYISNIDNGILTLKPTI